MLSPNSNGDVKEGFYSRLSAIIQNCPRRNITIMIGDFNAKTDSDNRGYEEIMGQRGEMNDNGERFASLCGVNRLDIGGSVFQHKRINKATWASSVNREPDRPCMHRKEV